MVVRITSPFDFSAFPFITMNLMQFLKTLEIVFLICTFFSIAFFQYNNAFLATPFQSLLISP